jgi:hypothetical protein
MAKSLPILILCINCIINHSELCKYVKWGVPRARSMIKWPQIENQYRIQYDRSIATVTTQMDLSGTDRILLCPV